MEAIKIDDLTNNTNRGKSAKGASFWKDIESSGVIPCRTAESMRQFLKTRLNLGLQRFLSYAVENNISYCHNYPDLPKLKENVKDLNEDER